MRILLRSLFAAIATVAVLVPGPASAADEDDAPLASNASARQPVSAPAWAVGKVVDERELAEQRGGADLHLNENNASAIVRDNVATNLSTGNNSINGDSFSGMSGVPMVVQNSGNNVVIQNSTILNLQLQ